MVNAAVRFERWYRGKMKFAFKCGIKIDNPLDSITEVFWPGSAADAIAYQGN